MRGVYVGSGALGRKHSHSILADVDVVVPTYYILHARGLANRQWCSLSGAHGGVSAASGAPIEIVVDSPMMELTCLR